MQSSRWIKWGGGLIALALLATFIVILLREGQTPDRSRAESAAQGESAALPQTEGEVAAPATPIPSVRFDAETDPVAGDHQCRVSVIDRGGAAIKGARVEFVAIRSFADPTPSSDPQELTTDAMGQAILRHPEAVGFCKLRVRAKGYCEKVFLEVFRSEGFLELELADGYRVYGRVLNAEGQGQAGVTLTFTSIASEPQTTVSMAEGAYEFSGVGSGRANFTGSIGGRPRIWHSLARIREDTQLDLRLPERLLLTGRVVASGSARPIAGAAVKLLHYDGHDYANDPASNTVTVLDEGVCDSLGVFRFENAPRFLSATDFMNPHKGHLAVVLTAEGHASRYVSAPLASSTALDLGDLELAPACTLRGTVQDSDGKPLAAAVVSVVCSPMGVIDSQLPGDPDHPAFAQFLNLEMLVRRPELGLAALLFATTDDQGRYVFEGLPAAGDNPEALLRLRYGGGYLKQRLVAGGEVLAPPMVVSRKGCPPFELRVVDAMTGEPIAGASANVNQWRFVSDLLGIMSVRLSHGVLEPGQTLLIAKRGYAPVNVTIPKAAPSDRIAVALQKVKSLRGVIRRANGRPFANATVRFCNLSMTPEEVMALKGAAYVETQFAIDKTDAEGRFSVRVPLVDAVHVGVEVRPGEDLIVFPRVRTDTNPVQLTLPSALDTFSEIRVRIEGAEDEKPIALEQKPLFANRRGPVSSRSTGVGTFVVDASADEDIEVIIRGFERARSRHWLRRDNGDKQVIRLSERAVATLTLLGGMPAGLPRQDLRIIDTATDEVIVEQMRLQESMALKGLKDGSYRIDLIRRRGAEGQLELSPREFSLPRDRHLQLRLTLQPPEGR